MHKFAIELPFPPSVNTYYRHVGYNKVLISEKGRKYRKNVSSVIFEPPKFKGEVHVSVVLCPPDKRKRDLDNFDGKALWDALTYSNVWEDDSQVKSRYSEWGRIVKGGKVFVEVLMF